MSKIEKYTVLIIEDNLLNLELVTDLLQATGHNVAFSPTAEEGIQLAQHILPDIILMDLSLPGMDGLTAARKLRATPSVSTIPIIALTAHAMKGDKERALAAGCAGYLEKPIDTRSFVTQITRHIHSSRRANRICANHLL